jgi:ethanolamine utilization protein EutA
MHDVEFDHLHVTPEQAESLSETIWRADNVRLTTIGVDIGSSTSHFMISRVHLQRPAGGLSSRFVVVGREELRRSPIMLTPYRPDSTIDVDRLRAFIRRGYATARMTPEDIDSGAVILTGEALKRRNARAIAELFAAQSGRFVCAAAGHRLECALAAQGSGAVALSRRHGNVVMNIDIGGGTTKFALVQAGEILATAAVAVGGRLVVLDAQHRIVRLEEPAMRLGAHLRCELALGQPMADGDRRALVRAMREIMVELARQGPPSGVAAELMVTEPLPRSPSPDAVTFSGGIAEFLFGRERGDFQDLGPALGRSLGHALADGALPAAVWDPGQGIRATVIGASQFTVQVSGNTILVSDPKVLPVTNLPVLFCDFALGDGPIDTRDVARRVREVLVRHDLDDRERMVALAFRWAGPPRHDRLHALVQGLAWALPKTVRPGGCLVLLADGDVGKTLGRIVRDEVAPGGEVISVDGLKLRDFDYVDIGEMIEPTGVVPVIIKTLLFPAGPG